MVAFLKALSREDLAPVTVRGYRSDLGQFAAWYEGHPIEKLTASDLAHFRQYLSRDRAMQPASVNHFRKQPSRRDASKWFCYCWPSQRSMQRIRDKVKAAIARDNPHAAGEAGPAEPDIAGMDGLLRLAQLSPALSEGGSICHVETSTLVAGEASAPTAGVLENASGLLEKGRPVLDTGSDCAYELNAAGGRLPESRMRYVPAKFMWRPANNPVGMNIRLSTKTT